MKVNYWKGYALLTTAALAFVIGNSILPADAGPSPHMHSALQKLEGALAQLDKAKGDFGGHRAKALDATRLAIAETKAGIAFKDEKPGPGGAPAPTPTPPPHQ